MKSEESQMSYYWVVESREDAVRMARQLHLRSISFSVLSSYPLKELEAYQEKNSIAPWVFAGGLIGVAASYGLCLWASFAYPLNIAGQSLHNIAYAPPIYVMTILFLTLSVLAGFCYLGDLMKWNSARWEEQLGHWVEDGRYVVQARLDPDQARFFETQSDFKGGRNV